MDNSYLIKTDELVKVFPMGETSIIALNHVNLMFKKAEFAGLVGPSGSGKTTLLNIIGSLDSPTEGSATVMGQKIEDLSHKQGAELRNRHIGFIFQTFNLLPVYTVFENVEFPLLLLDLSPQERKDVIEGGPAIVLATSGKNIRNKRILVLKNRRLNTAAQKIRISSMNCINIPNHSVNINRNLFQNPFFHGIQNLLRT